VKATAEAHADKQIALWFMDKARVGQKGRTTHRWWVRGQRPPGIADKRFESAYIFVGVQPSTGEDFALVLPRVSAAAMSTFLAEFAKTVPEDTHAVMVLDQAGWHDTRALSVPASMTLVPLPAYRGARLTACLLQGLPTLIKRARHSRPLTGTAAANWTPEPTYSGRPRRAGRFHVMAELGHSALPTSASICEADQLFLANVESINVALAAAVKGRRHGNRAALRLWHLDGRPPLRG